MNFKRSSKTLLDQMSSRGMLMLNLSKKNEQSKLLGETCQAFAHDNVSGSNYDVPMFLETNVYSVEADGSLQPINEVFELNGSLIFETENNEHSINDKVLHVIGLAGCPLSATF